MLLPDLHLKSCTQLSYPGWNLMSRSLSSASKMPVVCLQNGWIPYVLASTIAGPSTPTAFERSRLCFTHERRSTKCRMRCPWVTSTESSVSLFHYKLALKNGRDRRCDWSALTSATIAAIVINQLMGIELWLGILYRYADGLNNSYVLNSPHI